MSHSAIAVLITVKATTARARLFARRRWRGLVRNHLRLDAETTAALESYIGLGCDTPAT